MTKFFFVRLICHKAIANRVKNFQVKGKRSLTKTHDYFSWLTLYLLPSVKYSLFVRLYLNTCVLSIRRVYVWVFIYVYASDMRIRSCVSYATPLRDICMCVTLRTICKSTHSLLYAHILRTVSQTGGEPLRTSVYASRRHYTPRIVQFEAAFGESSRQPVERPISEPLSFYAHIWQELWIHKVGEEPAGRVHFDRIEGGPP